MSKSYRVIAKGGPDLRDKIKDNSRGVFQIETGDSSFTLAHLISDYDPSSNKPIIIGYCTDGSRCRWQTVSIARRSINSMQRLSP